MTREEFDLAHAQVESLYTQRHAFAVEGLIKWLRPRAVLEIGAFKGYLSISAMRALQEVGAGGVLHVVDAFADWRTNPVTLRETLSRFGDNFTIQVATSETMEVPTVDLALIDADHTYEWTRRDILNAMKAGAWAIGVHDSEQYEGVRMAVDEVRRMHNWGVIEAPFDSGYAIMVERFDTGSWTIPQHKAGP